MRFFDSLSLTLRFLSNTTGSSDYFTTQWVNNQFIERRCSVQDVNELMGQHHVDLDNNRFLILQGEIESIAMMPPKAKSQYESGLLEYLEDIIGTTKYQPLIESHTSQLDTLNESRTEKLTRVKYFQRELDSLEPLRIEAEKWQRDEHHLELQRALLVQCQRLQQNRKLIQCQEDSAKFKAQLDSERQRLGLLCSLSIDQFFSQSISHIVDRNLFFRQLYIRAQRSRRQIQCCKG